MRSSASRVARRPTGAAMLRCSLSPNPACRAGRAGLDRDGPARNSCLPEDRYARPPAAFLARPLAGDLDEHDRVGGHFEHRAEPAPAPVR